MRKESQRTVSTTLFSCQIQLLTSFHESFSGITKKNRIECGKLGTLRTMFVMADNTAN